MSKFFSIPGTSVRNSTDGRPKPPLPEQMRNHPRFKEFYRGRDKRGDDAQVGLPVGTPITVNGQAGVVESESRDHDGTIRTVVRGERSETREVRWGQNKAGEIVVADSKRIHS